MNIVFVNATRRFGGVKAWTLDMCSSLDALGHSTWIFARKGPFLEKAQATGLNAREGWFGLDYHPVSILRYRHFFKQNKVDAVVCNVGKDLRIAGIAARLCGIPVVHRVGLPRDMRDTPKVRNTHRFTAASILVPCRDIKNGLLDEMSFLSPDEITVILTGKEPSPQSPPLPRSPRNICVTSQLNPDKGHADLLQSLAILKSKGYAFHLHVAGTGKCEDDLKRLAARLNLVGDITWHGFVKDVRSVLKQNDIFCLPSLSEGLPNTLLEAMSEGLAPVARNVGGIAEAWPDTIAPFPNTLVTLDSGFEGLAEALESLLQLDDEQLAAHKQSVWQWFSDNHSLDVRAREFAHYISEL